MAVTGEMCGCRVADAWHLDRIRVALPAAGSSRLSNPAAAAPPPASLPPYVTSTTNPQLSPQTTAPGRPGPQKLRRQQTELHETS